MKLTKTGGSLKSLSPLLDVHTHWGSTFTMVEHAIQCKSAYNTVLLDVGHYEFTLDTMALDHLQALKNLLQTFNFLTKTICTSKSYATINLTIITYNTLMETVVQFVHNESNIQDLPDLCHRV